MGVSSNQMKKVTNFLRSNAGKQSVPAFYNTKHVENSRKLEHLYKEGVFDFDIGKNKMEKEKRPVVWADAEELLNAILEERGETGNVLIKVMADGGQGFFKICLTIFPEKYSPELDCNIDDSDQETGYNSPIKKRSLYSEGGSIGKKGKLTGVHRLIMLCAVPDVKETYENIALLFKLTNINNNPFKFVSDFKVILIVNGQQTATSTYPCPDCFVTLKELRNGEEECADKDEENDVNSVTKSTCLESCNNGCMRL